MKQTLTGDRRGHEDENSVFSATSCLKSCGFFATTEGTRRRTAAIRVPVITLLMVSGALAVALFPDCAPRLIYDRSAILSGQIWRMFTCHWVHFSARQLISDVIPLAIIGWIIESRRLPGFGWLCALAPWTISAALLVFAPQMQYCAGLSGLATAAITFLARHGLSGRGAWRRLCIAALLILAAKTSYELFAGNSLFGTFKNLPVFISTPTHIAGAVTALAAFCATKMRRRLLAPKPDPSPFITYENHQSP